jgi:hypothetical protein
LNFIKQADLSNLFSWPTYFLGQVFLPAAKARSTTSGPDFARHPRSGGSNKRGIVLHGERSSPSFHRWTDYCHYLLPLPRL